MRPQSAHSGLRGPPLNLCDIIQRGYLPQVPMLIHLGTDLESRDATGRTPLMLTAYVQPEQWGVGVARLLIEMGVRMAPRDRHGMNALHHACVYERLELARVLLNAPDFDLGQADKFGNTALHYAAMSGNESLVRLVASNHRKFHVPLNKLNKNNRTARDEAIANHHHACAAILDEMDVPEITTSSVQDKPHEGSVTSLAVPMEASNTGGSELKAPEQDDARSVASNEGKLDQEDIPSNILQEADETGGLFPREGLEAKAEEEVRKRATHHHHSHASDKSSDNKARSSDGSQRLRRSARRRSSCTIRRLSVGSSCSSKSGVSTRKQPLLALRNGALPLGPTACDTETNHNENNNHDHHNNNNSNIINTDEVIKMDDVENELVNISDITKADLQKPLRRSSVLSETHHNIVNGSRTALNDNLNDLSRRPSKPVLIRSPSCESGRKRVPSPVERNRVPSPGIKPSPRFLLPNKKNPQQLIHVASEADFRNSPEYVLKLTRMEFMADHMQTEALPVLTGAPRPLSAVNYDHHNDKSNSARSWRDSIRFLYRHYEYQCAPSWRNAAKPPPDPSLLTPSFSSAGHQSEEGEEVTKEKEKEKRTRRPSSSLQRPGSHLNDLSTSSLPSKRRPMSTKQRKISASSPTSGPVSSRHAAHGEHSSEGATTVSSSESGASGQQARRRLDSKHLDPAPTRSN